jgi:hypothetical protein
MRQSQASQTLLQQPLAPLRSLLCFLFSVFAILDDECNMPKGSDDNIAPAISQLATRLAAGPNWSKEKPLLTVSKIGHDKFSVAHYAGDVRCAFLIWMQRVCCDATICVTGVAGAIYHKAVAGQEPRHSEH